MPDSLDKFTKATKQDGPQKIEVEWPPLNNEEVKTKIVFKEFDILPWGATIFLLSMAISIFTYSGIVLYHIFREPKVVEKIVYKTKKSVKYKTKWRTRYKTDPKLLRENKRLKEKLNEIDLHKHAIDSFYKNTDKGTIEVITY